LTSAVETGGLWGATAEITGVGAIVGAASMWVAGACTRGIGLVEDAWASGEDAADGVIAAHPADADAATR
jgi:hypothetical protein